MCTLSSVDPLYWAVYPHGFACQSVQRCVEHAFCSSSALRMGSTWSRPTTSFARQSCLTRCQVNAAFLRTFRILRVLRILRVVRFAKDIQILLETLFYSLPSLANITSLMFLMFFVFAILGMHMFGHVKEGAVPRPEFLQSSPEPTRSSSQGNCLQARGGGGGGTTTLCNRQLCLPRNCKPPSPLRHGTTPPPLPQLPDMALGTGCTTRQWVPTVEAFRFQAAGADTPIAPSCTPSTVAAD